ncbi:MAG: hypothetical protein ACI8TX_003614 [Hyphomicrobiaceae bacterium]
MDSFFGPLHKIAPREKSMRAQSFFSQCQTSTVAAPLSANHNPDGSILVRAVVVLASSKVVGGSARAVLAPIAIAASSIAVLAYYSTLFATDPIVRKDDYAKWALEDPAVNFAISARGAAEGVDHLGIQVDSEDALAEFTGRLEAAGAPALEGKGAACCYAKSEKTWSRDPAGVVWETFFTHGSSETFGKDAPKLDDASVAEVDASACCGGDAD